MPKVPQYQESQRFGNAPDARFSVNGRALASALGGEMWGAVDRAGQQLQATGGQMGGIVLDWKRVTATLKGMAIGGAMGAAGVGAQAAVRAAGGGALAQTAGGLAAEVATLPTAAAGLEGHLPEARDFADAAVLILGMKGLGGAGKAAGRAMEAGKSALEARLRTIHEKAGIAPERVARETRHDPALLDELLDPRKPVPDAFTPEAAEVEPAYQTVLRELYSDDRAIKMIFRETGVEPSLTDRGQLRTYLESLDPKEVKRLKLESPQDYLAVMKAITRRFFPSTMSHIKLRFMCEDRFAEKRGYRCCRSPYGSFVANGDSPFRAAFGRFGSLTPPAAARRTAVRRLVPRNFMRYGVLEHFHFENALRSRAKRGSAATPEQPPFTGGVSDGFRRET